MLRTLPGMLTEFRFTQALKAFFPMYVTVFGMDTLSSEYIIANAHSGISVIPLPITTDLTFSEGNELLHDGVSKPSSPVADEVPGACIKYDCLSK